MENNNGFSLKFIKKLSYQTEYGSKCINKFKYNEVKLHTFQKFTNWSLNQRKTI